MFIFDQETVHYKIKVIDITRCFGPMPQPFSLPPGKSYEHSLGLSFEFDYGLEVGKVYDAFLVYKNLEPTSHVKDQNYPDQENACWYGTIKSNTVRFKYTSTLKRDLQPHYILKNVVQALFDK